MSGGAAKKSRGKKSRRRSKLKPAQLTRLSDEELLDVRICDLDVEIAGTPLDDRIDKLFGELEEREIHFRPHFWLSDEWFTPDGITGVAIPFYLAHPRLMRLERNQMLEVEGGSEEWCMRILRHETGHAIDNAYRLRRRRRWRQIFGRASDPYPDTYSPKPYSRSFVLHLDMWYAQSHPVEDFAETFAVWLKPRSRWRSRYQGWPALKKLEFVDELMKEIRSERPKVLSRERCDHIRSMRKTLRQHYDEKRARYGVDHPLFYDNDLRRLFSDSRDARGPSAAAFMRRIRPSLRKSISRWTGQYQYTIDQVLTNVIERCQELKLRLDRPEADVEHDALIFVTIQTMNFLHGGGHRLAL